MLQSPYGSALSARSLAALAGMLLGMIQLSGCTYAASGKMEFEHPSIEPDPTEIVINGDQEFVGKCMDTVKRALEKRGRVLGRPLITKSEKFERIFRLDAEFSFLKDGVFVNRFICWETSDSDVKVLLGTGGEELKPLH